MSKKTNDDLLNELKAIAIKNNGKLLSNVWIKAKTKYQFEDNNGIIFEQSADSLKRNGWPNDVAKFLRISNSKMS